MQKKVRPKTNALVHHSGCKKSGTESKITLYSKQVEFIDSASFPRRLGSFMREKVTGKILIVKSRITYLITIQYCLGVHSFPKWLFHKLKLHVILTLITMYIYWRDLYDAVLQSQLSDGISEILLARRPWSDYSTWIIQLWNAHQSSKLPKVT